MCCVHRVVTLGFRSSREVLAADSVSGSPVSNGAVRAKLALTHEEIAQLTAMLGKRSRALWESLKKA